MINETEEGFGQTENFKSLLEEWFKLHPDRITKREANRLFDEAMKKKREGSLGESYNLFEEIVKGRPHKARPLMHYSIKNLADISVQFFDKKEAVEEKLPWAEKAYYWFGRLGKEEIDTEPPQSRFHTAIQLGELKYKHSLITDSTEQKRQLLEETYIGVESVKDIALSGKPSRQFIFHALLHTVAESFYPFTKNEEERRQWLQRWCDEAEACVGLAIPSNRQYYLDSMAIARKNLLELPNQ